MRRLSQPLFVLCVSLGLGVGCGSAEDVTPSSEPSAQVRQGSDFIPKCDGGWLDFRTLWASSCGACTETAVESTWTPGALGYPGTVQVRCCVDSSCGSWLYHRTDCGVC